MQEGSIRSQRSVRKSNPIHTQEKGAQEMSPTIHKIQSPINSGSDLPGTASRSEHHFIVTFDSKSKKWKWDTDTEEARFDGSIYLEGEWVNSSHSQVISDRDTEASDQLSKAIEIMNGASK
jgi:hypothetical protein